MIKLLLINSLLVFALGIAKAHSDIVTEPVELSLSTIVLFSMDKNPDILMAVERQKQMEYFVKEARSDYYPQIEMKLEGGREYITPTGGKNINNLAKSSVTLNQKVFDGFTTTSEVNRRKELKNAADLDINKEKEDIILQVTGYYLDILRYQSVSKSTVNFVSEIDRIVKTIADMYEAGAVGKAMLDYAESRQAAAYVDLTEAKSSLNDGISNLEFLTGALPPFKAVPPDQFSPNNINKNIFIDRMERENTLMKKSKSEMLAMGQQLKSETGQYYPKIDFRMKAQQTHNDGGEVGRARDMKGTVNLTYNIFDGFNKKNRVGRVRGQIRELEYRDEKIYKELKKSINLAYNQISALRESIKATNQEIRSNKALQGLNRENFKLGSLNVIELIEGEERLNSANNKKYKLLHELHESTYSLLVTTAIIKDKFFCETCNLISGTKK